MNSLWGHVIGCSNCTSREMREKRRGRGGWREKERREGRREGERGGKKGGGESERGGEGKEIGEGKREGERMREDIGGKTIKVRGSRKEERRLTTNSIFLPSECAAVVFELKNLPSPKSPSLTTAVLVTNTLAGFISVKSS